MKKVCLIIHFGIVNNAHRIKYCKEHTLKKQKNIKLANLFFQEVKTKKL